MHDNRIVMYDNPIIMYDNVIIMRDNDPILKRSGGVGLRRVKFALEVTFREYV